jgi:hypothetical protein
MNDECYSLMTRYRAWVACAGFVCAVVFQPRLYVLLFLFHTTPRTLESAHRPHKIDTQKQQTTKLIQNMKFSTNVLLIGTVATLGVAHAQDNQDQSLRGKTSTVQSRMNESHSKGGSEDGPTGSSVYVSYLWMSASSAVVAPCQLFVRCTDLVSQTRQQIQLADLGDYGKFTIYTDKDDSKMGWSADLKNLGSLPVEGELTGLYYHLHSRWPQGGGSYSDDAAVCGDAGGHYDPYFGCGPASEQPEDVCFDIGREKGVNYACSSPDTYDLKQYDKCEVGDLSGKYGSLTVQYNDRASTDVKDDPFPALDYHYDDENEVLDPFKFASIVFHNVDGGDRVLCGKLVKIE